MITVSVLFELTDDERGTCLLAVKAQQKKEKIAKRVKALAFKKLFTSRHTLIQPYPLPEKYILLGKHESHDSLH